MFKSIKNFYYYLKNNFFEKYVEWDEYFDMIQTLDRKTWKISVRKETMKNTLENDSFKDDDFSNSNNYMN